MKAIQIFPLLNKEGGGRWLKSDIAEQKLMFVLPILQRGEPRPIRKVTP